VVCFWLVVSQFPWGVSFQVRGSWGVLGETWLKHSFFSMGRDSPKESGSPKRSNAAKDGGTRARGSGGELTEPLDVVERINNKGGNMGDIKL